MRCGILVLLVAMPCWGQTTPTTTTGTAKTSGLCSPAVTGNKNTFTINCGIGKAQGDTLIKIVNKILSNQTDLQILNERLDEILKGVNDLKQSTNPNRAVVTYDFNGFKRTTSPGRMEADDSAAEDFKKFGERASAKDWRGLLLLGEEQEKLRPEWLTPYLAMATAHSEVCNKQKAIEALKYFVERADGSPSFANAVKDAKQNLEMFEAGHWPAQCPQGP